MLTEKRCMGPCGRLLSVGEFHWKSKRKGTRQARCKDCMRDYGHQHYLANSEGYKERANLRLSTLRAENRKLVKEHLSAHPCSKCGEADPKFLTVSVSSTEVNNLATEALQARLSFSTVLCHNCKAAKD